MLKRNNESSPTVLKSSNSSGAIDLVQKSKKQQNVTSLAHGQHNKTVAPAQSALKANSSTQSKIAAPKNSTTPSLKTNQSLSHAEIEEVDEDTDMETEEDIVESEEEQDKDFQVAEQQEKAAVETDEEGEDSFSSHTDKSLREEQEKWTQAEEMDEQNKLKAELEVTKKQQEELLKKEQLEKQQE